MKNIRNAETTKLGDNDRIEIVFENQPSYTFRISREGDWLQLAFIGIQESKFWMSRIYNIKLKVGKQLPLAGMLGKGTNIRDVELTEHEKNNIRNLVVGQLGYKIASISVPNSYK